MRRLFLPLCALLFLWTPLAHAQSPWSFWVPSTAGSHGSHGQITSATLASATGLAASITGGLPSDTSAAVVCNTGTASANYRYDATAPTASVGTTLAAGACIPLSNPTIIKAIQFIETASGAQIDVDFFKCTVGSVC